MAFGRSPCENEWNANALYVEKKVEKHNLSWIAW